MKDQLGRGDGLIKRIPITININEYLVDYTYYKRNGKFTKDSVTISHVNIDSVRTIFKCWAKKKRTMSNVEILDIKLLNECTNVINV